ncbi:FecR domain-containing protein [Leptospira interrogans]|uniref:Sigma factor regulatory protein, FecR/PupR family n=1 Tax=Leptospira interrogans str. UI 12758 TaxID=1049938 RepID=A0A0E2CYU1_LEPIR|nr:FecR family protein [Leptospira interrogans]EKR19755.1 sigma factor regulatory protein, FecR/PupR family [Leptospira interrogans serovar Pyrogenes str. 2006006960]EKR52904.1 sigma factor regulatory protein, FecR/PupR family [Leptospira interrogans str. UI 12758]EMN54389.1 sigma factor regulatory protein, FecR/PupR family [Leptospira interrogans serovar Autumnalis str. LP101]
MIHNVLFLVAFYLFLPQILFADEEIAIVLFVTGKVQYSQAGKIEALKKNVILTKNAKVETGEGKADLQLGANAVIRIAPFTKIEIAELFSDNSKNTAKLTLVSGKLFTNVQKSNKKEELEISSASYTAGVRGTQFVISEEKTKAPKNEDSDIPEGVFVNEGEVTVHPSSGNDLNLQAGEQASWNGKELLAEPLKEFMKEKMKIIQNFKAIKSENYQMLKEQKLKNKELLENFPKS